MPYFNPPPDPGWMGDRKRGAGFGRPTTRSGATAPQKFSLMRVRLDSGGYDSGGAYWGVGTPLYHFSDATGSIEGYVRGRPREDAKAAVRAIHPHARFYR